MMCWSIYTLQYMAGLVRPPFAFRDLSALGNLQVMTLFALRCVLHRSPSRDIHRWALSSGLHHGSFPSQEERPPASILARVLLHTLADGAGADS